MKIIAALNNVQQSISALYNDDYFDVFTYAKNFILIVSKLYANTKGVDHYTSLVWLLFLAYLYQNVKHVNEAC